MDSLKYFEHSRAAEIVARYGEGMDRFAARRINPQC
jgi:hypothetical protein